MGKGFADPAGFVRHLSKKQRMCPPSRLTVTSSHVGTGAIVVLTGVVDYVSDGIRVARLSNGHPLLGEITGSGCMVGTAVATFCAGASMDASEARSPKALEDAKLVRGDMFIAAIAGWVYVHLPSL